MYTIYLLFSKIKLSSNFVRVIYQYCIISFSFINIYFMWDFFSNSDFDNYFNQAIQESLSYRRNQDFSALDILQLNPQNNCHAVDHHISENNLQSEEHEENYHYEDNWMDQDSKINSGDHPDYSQDGVEHAIESTHLGGSTNPSKSQENPLFPDPSNSKDQNQDKKQKKVKKDQMRNLYPNVMKALIRLILTDDKGAFAAKIQKACKRASLDYAPISPAEFKEYCEGIKSLDFSLKDVYHLLNYQNGTEEEKLMKRVFHQVFVWFVDRRYSVYILRSEQCQFKKQYLRGKNLLKYLPEINPKKTRCSQKIRPLKNL